MGKIYSDINAPIDFCGMSKEEYIAVIHDNEVALQTEGDEYWRSENEHLIGLTAEEIFNLYLRQGIIFAKE